MILKAEKALHNQNVEERDITCVLVPANSQAIGKAKKVLDEFRTRFKQEFRNITDSSDVYALNLQFFRVTEKNK